MMKIMPLGDSLTFGVVNNDTKDDDLGGYRTALWDSLKSDAFNVDFVGPLTNGENGIRSIDQDNAGFRGWRIDQLSNGRGRDRDAGNIDEWLSSENPDIVLLMAGTNDILQNKSATQARDDLRALIQTIISDGAQVFVASIPPLNPASDRVTQAQADTVDAFNALLPGLVAEFAANVRFVDVAGALNGVNDVSSDGIHLTSSAFSKVAAAWHNALFPVLNPTRAQTDKVLRNTPIRIEAENFDQLGLFAVEDPAGVPSPIQVLSLSDASDNQASNDPITSTATKSFTFPSGRYDVVIGYFDESDGSGTIQATIGDDVLPELEMNGDFGSSATSTRNFVHRTIAKSIEIKTGDLIQLTGTSDGDEFVRIDYIEFVPIRVVKHNPPPGNGGGNKGNGSVGTPPAPINFSGGRRGNRVVGNGDRNRLVGTGRNDVLIGRGNRDVLRGRNGKDRIEGNDGRDRLFGQGGNDTLRGGNDNDTLRGGGGRDFLNGQAGRDRLLGQGGADILIGGSGKDVLTGNQGRDVFLFQKLSDGVDTITDFRPGEDMIDVREILNKPAFEAPNPFAKFQSFIRLSQRGSAVAVQIDGDGNGAGKNFQDLAILRNSNLNGVTSRDFLIE
ncbi:MAG: GDSL-type esterase/lipase family protein [Cyanobacteria bacterium J06633_2]